MTVNGRVIRKRVALEADCPPGIRVNRLPDQAQGYRI